MDKGHKGMFAGISVHHFPNRPHHQVKEEPNNDVYQQDRWTSPVNRTPGSQEQPGPNGPTNRDHLHI